MSTPTSLKAGPITTNTLVHKRYTILYVLIIWISALPVMYFVWKTWPGYYEDRVLFFVLLPVYAMLWYLLMVADSIVVSKFFLILIQNPG